MLMHEKTCVIPIFNDMINVCTADSKDQESIQLSIKSILSAPLWFNSHIRNGNNLYVKNWDNKGIKTIGDVLDNNGNFYTFDTLKEIYGVRGTFLNYENILHKIPNQWKNLINENRVFIYQKGIILLAMYLWHTY